MKCNMKNLINHLGYSYFTAFRSYRFYFFFFLLSFSTLPVIAQMCSFTKPDYGGVAQASPYAYGVLNNIKSALNVVMSIEKYIGPVQNAGAMVQPNQFGAPVPVIVYNANFLGSLYQKNQWAPISVVAHEVGHHINNDASWSRQMGAHPWSRELGADFISGCALARMGASLADATTALNSMFDGLGSPSHPDTPRRVNAVREGWEACGGRGQLLR